MSTAGARSISYGASWDRQWIELAAVAAELPSLENENRCYALLQDMRVFRTILPASLSGIDSQPLEAMSLIEDLSGLGGSIGWMSFVGITGASFAAELNHQVAKEIYADPDALVAYAGASNGTLTKRGDDFVLSGRWPVASGLTHAAWVALGCRVADASAPSSTAVAFVPLSECEVSFGWDPLGLPGTGTGSIAVDGLSVPARLVLRDEPADSTRRHGHRWRLLIPSMMASVSLGVARAALDEVKLWLAGEALPASGVRRADSEQVQHVLGRTHAELCSARAFMHQVVMESWRRMCNGEDLGLEQGALHRLAATHAATAAAETSSAVTALAGTRAVTASHPLCRRWIDARTITANVTVCALYYRVYGGVVAAGTIPTAWP